MLFGTTSIVSSINIQVIFIALMMDMKLQLLISLNKMVFIL